MSHTVLSPALLAEVDYRRQRVAVDVAAARSDLRSARDRWRRLRQAWRRRGDDELTLAA